jgi:hypothetical protein
VASSLRQVIAPEPDGDDALVVSLIETISVLEQVRGEADELIAKAHRLVTQQRAGRPWEEILRDEPSPRLSVLLARSSDALAGASSRVRRTQVETLYRRGMAMHRIGALLGITRQRVAVLLKATHQPDGTAVEDGTAAEDGAAAEDGKVGGTPR